MGNAPSATEEQQQRPALRNIFQAKNALGLSKSELDKRCRPSGLYPTCAWDEKIIRKLIGDGKIAARLIGAEDVKTDKDEECPICFLNYSETNVTSCCQAVICTECYLQVKPRGGKTGSCPFCNTARMRISVAKPSPKSAAKEMPPQLPPKNQSTVQEEETPEQAEAIPAAAATDASSIGSGGFGSSLEQHVKSRPTGSTNDNVRSLALTPEERQQLETQVRSQNYHPLTMRLQQEEAERRLRNEMEYYTSQVPAQRPERSRFISEEQQIALAIEASLRESS